MDWRGSHALLLSVMLLAGSGGGPADLDAMGPYAVYCTGITPAAETRRLVAKYLVAFLKTNLAGVADYQEVLTPGYALTSEPLIEFFVTEKASPESIDQEYPSFFFYFMHQSGSDQARAEKNPETMSKAVQRPWELPPKGGR